MKISRSSYFVLIALFLFFLFLTINQYSKEISRQLFLPFIIIAIILSIIGSIVAFKDKEFIRIIPDERTRKVDRSAGYYSWWSTLLFLFIFGFIADIKGLTTNQIISTVSTEMFFTLIVFHMYFYFKGEES
jgi:fucose 4-O-acetylase-like acetyltransferase